MKRSKNRSGARLRVKLSKWVDLYFLFPFKTILKLLLVKATSYSQMKGDKQSSYTTTQLTKMLEH